MNHEHQPQTPEHKITPAEIAQDLVEAINAAVTIEAGVRIGLLYNDHGPAVIAYTRLPDTNLEDPDLARNFSEAYVATHPSRTAAIEAELTDQGWTAATEEHCNRHGIPPGLLEWNHDAVWGAMNEMYDLVDYAGRIYVFWK